MNLINRTRLALSVARRAFASPDAAMWSGPGRIEQWSGLWDLKSPTNSGAAVDDWSAQTQSAVWACVSLLADTVAQLPIGLYQLSEDGNSETKITDHPVARMLREGFNADVSTELGIYTGQSQVGIVGNHYARIVRDNAGAPIGLQILNPYSTTPLLDVTAPYDIIVAYRYSDGRGGVHEFAPEDILHVRGHTTRGVIGISPITAAREAIGLSLAEEKFGSKFFGNDAKSGGYIIQPAHTGPRAKRGQQADVATGGEDGGQGGPDNAHKPKILDPGAKYIPVTISPEDSQFLESRAFQVAEIARFYRVPVVFLDSSSATAWGAGIEQLKIGFVELTVNPLVGRWGGEMTRKLLTPAERDSGMRVKMNSAVLLRGDMQARGEYGNKRILNGSLSRNEFRRMEGDNPIEGGDVPLIPVNMQDGTKPPKPPAATPPKGSAPNAPPA